MPEISCCTEDVTRRILLDACSYMQSKSCTISSQLNQVPTTMPSFLIKAESCFDRSKDERFSEKNFLNLDFKKKMYKNLEKKCKQAPCMKLNFHQS